MHISETSAVERVARVLAAYVLSRNGNGDLVSAGAMVDEHWRDHVDAAFAVLRTLREASAEMAAAGDPATWEKMVEAAIAHGLPAD